MMKKMLGLSAGIAVLDQAIKALVRTQPVGQTIFEIPSVAAVTHSVNTGAAFSMLSGHPALLALVTLALLTALCIYVSTQMRLTLAGQIAFGCMLGGGVGNLIDRIVFSGVTDYIRLLLFDFPIFNLADIAITVSIFVLIVLLFTGRLEYTTGERHGSDH